MRIRTYYPHTGQHIATVAALRLRTRAAPFPGRHTPALPTQQETGGIHSDCFLPQKEVIRAAPTYRYCRTLESLCAAVLPPGLAPCPAARRRSHSDPGRRMVSSVLRTVGLSQEQHFQTYHRVLNRAVWSSLRASRILLRSAGLDVCSQWTNGARH